jgi:hypothetical protein
MYLCTHHLRAALAVLLACCLEAVGRAQDGTPGQVFDTFFELGLPDASRAKWVRIQANEWSGAPVLPPSEEEPYTGNAWLLKESGNVVEVLKADGAVVRGKKGAAKKKSEEEDEEGGEEEEDLFVEVVRFRPADLEGDLKRFAAAIEKTDEMNQRMNGDDGNAGKRKVAGCSLLFLAQLHRKGRADFAKQMLPKVLALVPSPEMALDGAITQLAEGQMTDLARTWAAKRDAAAYANGIDALAAKFPRGWSTRDAALVLARRLREAKAAPLAGEEDAKKAAEFLLELKPGDLQKLPRGRNWFIPGSGTRNGFFPPGMAEAEKDAPEKKDDAVAKFFADKRAAAVALAKLLGDQRYVRGRYPTDSSTYYTREQIVNEQYKKMARPSELGEIVREVLAPLLPDSFNDGDTDRASKNGEILTWLKAAEGKSDEEFAWDALRTADNTYDETFGSALGYLAEHGSAETLAKLKEVFLDPGVWTSSSLDDVIPLVGTYVKRAPADPAFEEKVKTAAKAGLADEEAQSRSYLQGSGMEEYKKQREAMKTGQLRQLDAVFKAGGGLAEQFIELAELDEAEAMGALQPLMQTVAKMRPAEFEGPAFVAAAKAKSLMVKQQILQMLMMSPMREARKGGAKEATPLPKDPQAIEAMLKLLADETSAPNRWDPSSHATISSTTAGAILALHGEPANIERWQEFGQSIPSLAARLVRIHAEALAKGMPEPPLPNAANVPAEKTAAIVAELSATPADQVVAVLAGKLPDEQLAVAGHLQQAEEWPASLVAAHFTVAKVSVEQDILPDAQKWKGRRLDEAFVNEVLGSMVKAAANGKFVGINISVSGPLAGVEIGLTPTTPRYSPDMIKRFGFPGMEGKPEPIAVNGVMLRTGDARERFPPNFAFPTWKDEGITRAWREEHGKGKPGKKKEEPGRPAQFDPSAFEESLRKCLALKKEARGPAFIQLYSIAAGKKDENDVEN